MTATADTTVWIATVDTDYPFCAVDTDPETAITKACEAAFRWLVGVGVKGEWESPAEVRDYFGVGAYAVTVGTAVMVAKAEHHG